MPERDLEAAQTVGSEHEGGGFGVFLHGFENVRERRFGQGQFAGGQIQLSEQALSGDGLRRGHRAQTGQRHLDDRYRLLGTPVDHHQPADPLGRLEDGGRIALPLLHQPGQDFVPLRDRPLDHAQRGEHGGDLVPGLDAGIGAGPNHLVELVGRRLQGRLSASEGGVIARRCAVKDQQGPLRRRQRRRHPLRSGLEPRPREK